MLEEDAEVEIVKPLGTKKEIQYLVATMASAIAAGFMQVANSVTPDSVADFSVETALAILSRLQPDAETTS